MTPTDQTRLAKLDATIAAQRLFIHRVPDPDTRQRAEINLLRLVDMRDEVARSGLAAAE